MQQTIDSIAVSANYCIQDRIVNSSIFSLLSDLLFVHNLGCPDIIVAQHFRDGFIGPSIVSAIEIANMSYFSLCKVVSIYLSRSEVVVDKRIGVDNYINSCLVVDGSKALHELRSELFGLKPNIERLNKSQG